MGKDATKMEQGVRDRLLTTGIIGVVRLSRGDDLLPLAQALHAGGVHAVEITMTTPNALEAIRRVSKVMGDQVLVGAGTVLDTATLKQAVAAGASFVVSPTTQAELMATAKELGCAVVAGALTPTEVHLAMAHGADMIKLFPGRVATPGYFRDLLGPFPSARLMPTGNVDLETTPQYFAAGAVAVGVGKALIDPASVEAGDWASIQARATEFRAVVDETKRG